MFITEKSLNNLKYYKYSGVDHSLCANYILSPYFWEPLLTHCIPRSIAPNMITLIGGLFMVLAYILFVIESPTGTETVSTFTLVMSGILIFLYQTADNLDGKQARRTSNSSPLGELFDHGVDTFMMGIFSMIIVIVFKFDLTTQLFIFIFLLTVFYMSHWEEYHTNTLVLGYIFNPTELQLLCIVGLFIIAINPNIIYLEIFGITIQYWAKYCIIGFASLANSYYFYSAFSHINKTHCCTKTEALKHGLPYFCFTLMSFINILLVPNTFIISHYHLFIGTLIFINAYLTQRLIVHRICKESVTYYHTLLILYTLYTLNGILYSLQIPALNFYFSLRLLFVFALVFEISFIYTIITSFSKYLHINVLFITPKHD
ncbi:choline/ethanolaminephosphotransferase, putative [Entamoeba dispar SAW760]|uniref:Choline/ethanolaminephosphotransferase, putative n=1 Tax=Entamoeba dispar (strain ATCC PRA-260 / SAW760) TaxID=370354 RepID=B0EFG7_ENTDS|nr:choline/ethanolaminephosphotransferase, putative [Entamoeba dispar SAW760]EDR26746.1 choline/ethanolaminephosphotransferase, putative [Entamoeba dispar SAW760]|eukprot:EDR26746.1 choline/ethanolaminephosphotransferase, putative [Entamoeba dispar SAW760]